MKKKILATVMAGAMALAMMTGCGSAETAAPAAAPAETEEEAEATEETAEATEETTEAAADGQTYKIGICQLVQHEALDAATKGFQDALTEKLGDAVTFDYQDAAGDSATCATIVNGFVADGVDLIMANATPALQAASAATTEIPILGTSVTDYATALEIDDWTGATGYNVSGTSDLAPLEEQAKMFTEILPDAKNIGILYCSAEANSKYQSDVVSAALEGLGYTVNVYTFADTNDLQSVTQTACDENDALYIPTDNAAASATETIDAVALAAKTPIIAGEAGIANGCGIATLSISYYDLGYVTGEMAYEILVNGADISTMDVRFAASPEKKYVASRCEELGITVPDGYTALE